jgi:hypothetical protein
MLPQHGQSTVKHLFLVEAATRFSIVDNQDWSCFVKVWCVLRRKPFELWYIELPNFSPQSSVIDTTALGRCDPVRVSYP